MKMGWKETLFDNDTFKSESADGSEGNSSKISREVLPLDRLRNLEEKIAAAIERVKTLKEEKGLLERRIKDLETALNEKNQEVEGLRAEKSSIGSQIEELLSELETLEV